jgi:hypothetical protein
MPDYSQIPVGGPRAKHRGVALVDHADADAISAYRWHMSSNGYAQRNDRSGSKSLTVLMHRSLLGLSPGDPRQADHINGDRLDNRRVNLRVCTNAENHQNRHDRRYRGATWHTHRNRWRAHVTLDGRHHHLGLFDTQADAAAVAAAFRRSHMPFSADTRECPSA